MNEVRLWRNVCPLSFGIVSRKVMKNFTRPLLRARVLRSPVFASASALSELEFFFGFINNTQTSISKFELLPSFLLPY